MSDCLKDIIYIKSLDMRKNRRRIMGGGLLSDVLEIVWKSALELTNREHYYYFRIKPT